MGSYSGSVYTVKRGDTLYRISRATGTSVKDLARLNNLSALHHRGGAAAEAADRPRAKNPLRKANRQSDAVLSGAAIVMAAGWTALLDLACQR
jgi:murein DD-endopeptidase MepM/ murein hydrolase activator NlpD